MDILSAGHGLILPYRRGRDQMVEIAAHGPPLGILDHVDFRDPN